MTIKIVTDTTCDLPPDVIAKYDIETIPLHIHMGADKYLDGVDITKDEFYSRLPDYDPGPKTAAPSPNRFVETYQSLAEKGATAILSLHISEKLSATVNVARTAADEFEDIPVTVLDSGQLSMGLGFLVEKAAQLAAKGEKIQEIISTLEDQMERSYVFAALKTVEYLRRGGRMHIAVARLGEILRIKPLLHMHQGDPNAHRVRTSKKALARLLSWLEEYAPYERIAIVHAGVQAEAEALVDEVRKYLPEAEIPVLQITPVLGAHLGIGALGFAVLSK